MGLALVGCRLLWALAMIFRSSELNFSISNPKEISCVAGLILWALGEYRTLVVTCDLLIFESAVHSWNLRISQAQGKQIFNSTLTFQLSMDFNNHPVSYSNSHSSIHYDSAIHVYRI